MKLSEIKEITRNLPQIADSQDSRLLSEQLRAMGYDLSNFYQELEMSSQYVDTHRDVSFSNANVTLHSHTFWEILYCCNSCGVEYLVGADRYRLQKGDIVIVPPGISHRPLLPETLEESYRRYVLWINTEFLIQLQQSFPEDPELFGSSGIRLVRTSGSQWEFLGDRFRKGVEEAERKGLGWELLVAANTMEILVHLRRMIQTRVAKNLKAEKPELLDRVMAYVENHLAERITLADIARTFYVSESTVSQLFRKKMGVSFYRCVTQRRLIAAKLAIEDGQLLETVAEQVGFQDYSSFYRAFKQEYGISPRQYRQRV